MVKVAPKWVKTYAKVEGIARQFDLLAARGIAAAFIDEPYVIDEPCPHRKTHMACLGRLVLVRTLCTCDDLFLSLVTEIVAVLAAWGVRMAL